MSKYDDMKTYTYWDSEVKFHEILASDLSGSELDVLTDLPPGREPTVRSDW
jgi:hypothetical protein